MSCTAIILAGGRGSRLGFREKAFIDINGKPLIAYVIESLDKVVDDLNKVLQHAKSYDDQLDAKITDLRKRVDTLAKISKTA